MALLYNPEIARSKALGSPSCSRVATHDSDRFLRGNEPDSRDTIFPARLMRISARYEILPSLFVHALIDAIRLLKISN
ncbi:MAG: hypothetical protein ACI910_002805 [Oleispira sp.]|jgi:hypothetical protein